MIFGILQMATMVAALAAGPAAPPAMASLKLLAGDWVLAGSEVGGRLRLSANGSEVALSLRTADGNSDGLVEQRYHVSGALGAALVLEPVAAEQQQPGAEAPALPARARLLPVSPTVALWWQPHRRALFAYRERAVPAAFHGRYTIDKGAEELRSIEVTADAIVRRGKDDGDDQPWRIPIVAVTDVGADSVRFMLSTSTPGEALHIELCGSRAILVQEIPHEPDTILEGRLVPAGKPATADGGPAAGQPCPTNEELPPSLVGPFRLSSLTKNDEQALTITSSEWSFRPLGGMAGRAGWATVTAHLSPGAMRTTIRSNGHLSANLRSLGNDLWLLERDDHVLVMYRPDEPPPWAPAEGLADDVRRLCHELEAAGPRLDDGAVKAAFASTGRAVRSDVMRSLAQALLSVPAEFRAAVLERGLRDAGEPMPACPGVDRLRALPNQRRPNASDD